MKILTYVHAYPPEHMAGAETTLHDILRRLASDGFECTVLLSTRKHNTAVETYAIDGVKVIPFDPADKRALNRMVVDYDLVLSHLEDSERAAIVCDYASKPIVHLVHNTLWQTEGYLAEGCDLAIYNTNWVAAHHGYSRPDVALIAKSVDPETYSSKEPANYMVDFRIPKSNKWDEVVLRPFIDPNVYKTDGPHDSITLINLKDMKGPHVLYEMARRFPKIPFLAVIGGYGRQEIDDSLPNVEFIENGPNIVGEVYARTKILLMPSVYESYGRVAIEGAASGIPTIAHPTPGLQEALGPGGIYADRDDYEAWETAISALSQPRKYAAASRYAKKVSKLQHEQCLQEYENLKVALHRLSRTKG